jgi:hypothetical protein
MENFNTILNIIGKFVIFLIIFISYRFLKKFINKLLSYDLVKERF